MFHIKFISRKKYIKFLLTSTSQEDFDCDILKKVVSWEDGPDLTKVPFSMQMVAKFEHLQ